MLELVSLPNETVGVREATDADGRPTARQLRTARHSMALSAAFSLPSSPGAVEPSLSYGASDERLLAWLRLVAAFVLLLSVTSDVGPQHSAAARALIAAYTGYAGLLLLVSTTYAEWFTSRVNTLHVVDFAFAATVTSVSGGTASHFFPFFGFVVAASAFRWGLRRTLLDGALIVLVASAQGAVAILGFVPWPFELDLFLLRVAFIPFGIALLFGLLADRLHVARHQAAAVAGLVSALSRASHLGSALTDTLVSITRLMGAAHVLFVVEEEHTGLVSVRRTDVEQGGRISTSHSNLSATVAADWVLPRRTQLSPCELRRWRAGSNPVVATSPEGGMPPSTPWIALPPAVLAVSEWRELLAVPFAASGVWNGQLYVIDPVARPRGELRVRFLAAIAQQITPGLLNLYLVRRLRSRAESLERGRISRELHDGVLQSLAGIDMRLEVLRRQAAASESSDLADELGELQRLLQGESVDLRQLMLRLRPTDVDARRLPGAVADLIERFGRGGDIQARLEWAVSRLNLPPHHCSEILRIVQEALFNVRRHSGATRALVRVEADADAWALIVEDNGCGLGFTGRLTSEELELLAKGPRVIRERAVALGGLLSVESSDHGTRLEITFSREGRD